MSEEIRDLLARFGLVGADAETAYTSYLTHPDDSDGMRVARILQAHG